MHQTKLCLIYRGIPKEERENADFFGKMQIFFYLKQDRTGNIKRDKSEKMLRRN